MGLAGPPEGTLPTSGQISLFSTGGGTGCGRAAPDDDPGVDAAECDDSVRFGGKRTINGSSSSKSPTTTVGGFTTT